MKLCRDCQWMRNPGEFAECHAPQNIAIIPKRELATGFPRTPEMRWKFCVTQRIGGWFAGWATNSCGDGRWFQSKIGRP